MFTQIESYYSIMYEYFFANLKDECLPKWKVKFDKKNKTKINNG